MKDSIIGLVVPDSEAKEEDMAKGVKLVVYKAMTLPTNRSWRFEV